MNEKEIVNSAEKDRIRRDKVKGRKKESATSKFLNMYRLSLIVIIILSIIIISGLIYRKNNAKVVVTNFYKDALIDLGSAKEKYSSSEFEREIKKIFQKNLSYKIKNINYMDKKNIEKDSKYSDVCYIDIEITNYNKAEAKRKVESELRQNNKKTDDKNYQSEYIKTLKKVIKNMEKSTIETKIKLIKLKNSSKWIIEDFGNTNFF